MDPGRPGRHTRSGTISHTAIMIAAMVAVLSVTLMARLVHDMATLADLFSILAFLVALSIYYVARRFAERARAAHESELQETDRRDMGHAVAMVHTCRSVAVGISRPPAISGSSVLVLTQGLATTIGTVQTQHDHLFSEEGRLAAASAHAAALLILESGEDCLGPNASRTIRDLGTLSDSVLDLDDESLVERRRRAADAERPA